MPSDSVCRLPEVARRSASRSPGGVASTPPILCDRRRAPVAGCYQPFDAPTRWSKRIRPTGPTCDKSACLHFPRQIAALKHLHTIDPKRTIRRQA
ncbi:hypothetical protein CFB41_22505 [Burkholderia sp. AU33803]|nr:hypothetical protein CFB41_22505 [Burkholderia sp. AU33803]